MDTMTHDNEMLHILMLGIASGYLIIAVQFFMRLAKFKKTKNKRAYLALFLFLAVFLLCALAGYIGKALGWSLEVEMALHIILFVFTYWLVFTNQISVVLDGMADGFD